ncbi:MAG: hypothetical protein OXF02_07460 [Simkaniaceae bacterium]|nr:hypothetical protein [Simkaniaceae bacterium]
MNDSTRTKLSEVSDKLIAAQLALKEHLADDGYTGSYVEMKEALGLCIRACNLLGEIEITPGETFHLARHVLLTSDRLTVAQDMYDELEELCRGNEFARNESLYSWARTLVESAQQEVTCAQDALKSLGIPKEDKDGNKTAEKTE